MENIEYVRPQDIEKRSFAIISQELEEKGIVLPKEQELVTKRAIHTSADFDYAKTMTYSDHAVEIAKRLIQNGADIVTDTNMALAGVNKKELAIAGQKILRRMIDKFEIFNQNAEILRIGLSEQGLDPRGCDQFGTLIAASETLLKEKLISSEDIAFWAVRLKDLIENRLLNY